MSGKPSYTATMQAGAPYSLSLTNLVKVVAFMCTKSPAHHVVCGQKTLQMHGFPVQTHGESVITLILRCKSKLRYHQVFSYTPTHMYMYTHNIHIHTYTHTAIVAYPGGAQ